MRSTGIFKRKRGNQGNVLFIILAAVALFALLSKVVLESENENLDYTQDLILDEQIDRLLNHGTALSSAVQQMVFNGANPNTLYTNLDTVVSGGTGWDTSPHTYKIFHPYGGGVRHMSGTGTVGSSASYFSSFDINADAIIEGIGATDTTIGDIVFVSAVSNSTACARINTRVSGSSSIPVISNAGYTALIGTPASVTVNAAMCANCVNVARACIVNTAGDAWGYYQVLLPG